MNKPFAIFDMDGTLIDSMKLWRNLGREYLETKGITEDLNDILEEIRSMTVSEAAELFVSRFGLKDSPKAVTDEMNDIMDAHYRKESRLLCCCCLGGRRKRPLGTDLLF